MNGLRPCAGLLLVLALGVPLLLPLLKLLRTPEAWYAWREGSRILGLAANSVALVLGTLLLALPTGTALAILLHRTDLPCRRGLRILLLLAVFVPLPLSVSGWMAVLDWAGLFHLSGLSAAIVLHSLVGLPWVVLLTGIGLDCAERGLEEDGLTLVPARQVLWRITLPRVRLAIAAAALWVALQTSVEIGITNLYQVRTFAEEVNTQLVRPEVTPLGLPADVLVSRSVAVSLPALLLITVALLTAVVHGRHALPPLDAAGPALTFRLGRARTALSLFALVIVAALMAAPVLGLIWKVGAAGYPPVWSRAAFANRFSLSFRASSGAVGVALIVAAGVAALTVAAAVSACWLARGSRWFGGLLAGLVVLAAALPGPIVGIGLKDTIEHLLSLTGSEDLATFLYHGPSWAPVVWAQMIRLFPLAVILLWPMVRSLPHSVFESARLDGASPAQEFFRIVLPLTGRHTCLTAAVIAALSLGEISASKLVSTAGSQSFCELLFMQMHKGVDGDVAALSLLLLAAVMAFAAIVAVLWQWS